MCSCVRFENQRLLNAPRWFDAPRTSAEQLRKPESNGPANNSPSRARQSAALSRGHLRLLSAGRMHLGENNTQRRRRRGAMPRTVPVGAAAGRGPGYCRRTEPGRSCSHGRHGRAHAPGPGLGSALPAVSPGRRRRGPGLHLFSRAFMYSCLALLPWTMPGVSAALRANISTAIR